MAICKNNICVDCMRQPEVCICTVMYQTEQLRCQVIWNNLAIIRSTTTLSGSH